MSEKIFILGDRVQVKNQHTNQFTDLVGTVIRFAENSEKAIGVEFDFEVEGAHDCGGSGVLGRCYYFLPSTLRLC